MRARLLMLLLALSVSFDSSAWALPSFIVSQPLVVPRKPKDIAVGDINGDGIDDIAVVSRGSNKISLVLVQPDGTFRQGASIIIGSRMQSIGIGDFDIDGKADVVVSTGTRNIFVIHGNGDGTFGRSQSIKRCCSGAGLTVGDFDNSLPPGSMPDDVAIADASKDDVNILFNKDMPGTVGLSPTGARVHAGNKPSVLLTDYFNGDSKYKFDPSKSRKSGRCGYGN